MDLQKKKRYRNKKYRDYIKTLECCCGCGKPADDCHHAIGVGEGGTALTASDLLTMPMTRGCHTKIHNTPEIWPEQWRWIAKTLEKAIEDGFSF